MFVLAGLHPAIASNRIKDKPIIFIYFFSIHPPPTNSLAHKNIFI